MSELIDIQSECQATLWEGFEEVSTFCHYLWALAYY